MSERLLPRLWQDHVRVHLPVLLVALVLMTLEGATLGVMSYLVQPLFDDVFVAGNAGAVTGIAAAIAGLFVLRAAAGFGQRILVMGVGLRVTTALQTRLLGHLLGLDAGYFQAHPPGDLIERVRGDTLALQQTASAALMSLGRDAISVVSLLAVMLWIDWRWAAIALVGVPVLILPLALLQRWIRATTRAARSAAGSLSTRLDEIFHGMVSIKVNRLEAHETGRFGRVIDAYLGAQLRSETGKAALPAVIDIIAAAGFLGVLLVGGAQILAGEKTVGAFMSFFTAMALLFDPLRRLSQISGQLQAALASLERLYTVLEARATILPPAAPRRPDAGAVRFEDVVFGYGETPILRGLTFTAEAGQTTAIVGPSGAGKSTLFSLLSRLIDVEDGRVTIGGTDVREADLNALRDMIAVVGQDTALFDETIAENIRLGRLDATLAEIEAAAAAASVDVFASEMASGLDTRVGPRGMQLSGGQRQRVAIARAVLRNAPILLLDEPTSALDAGSEQLVQAALERLADGRTTLTIAHRLSTVRAAHKIVVLDQGRVVETGTHASLLNAGGLYATLAAMQGSATPRISL
ncbi:MAG: ABC transporter ATP-binding protein [Pseudomonadota bacterium]